VNEERSSARCSICAATYPPHMEDTLCPVCGERLGLVEDEAPDPELEERHGSRKPIPLPRKLRRARMMESGEQPEPAQIVPQVRADEHGLLWLAEAELKEFGYYALADFDVVDLGGASYELQGFRASSGEW
jgi:uncharacterized Zn finger protein (UPF0148 family)